MITPDWSQTDTQEKLEQSIGNGFKVRLGWTETPTYTTLCVEADILGGVSHAKYLRYTVFVWSRPGVRAELAYLLGKDVYTE